MRHEMSPQTKNAVVIGQSPPPCTHDGVPGDNRKSQGIARPRTAAAFPRPPGRTKNRNTRIFSHKTECEDTIPTAFFVFHPFFSSCHLPRSCVIFPSRPPPLILVQFQHAHKRPLRDFHVAHLPHPLLSFLLLLQQLLLSFCGKCRRRSISPARPCASPSPSRGR